MGNYLNYIAQNEIEAVTAIVAACTSSNPPYLSENEAARLTHLRIRSIILPSANDNRIVLSVFAIAEGVGSRGLIDGAIERLHKSDYETVFSYCCEMAYSHGSPSKYQQETLKYIASLLSISNDFFKSCLIYQRAYSRKVNGYLPQP